MVWAEFYISSIISLTLGLLIHMNWTTGRTEKKITSIEETLKEINNKLESIDKSLTSIQEMLKERRRSRRSSR